MGAKVEQRHREAARFVVYGQDALRIDLCRSWVDSGDTYGMAREAVDALTRAAQALADAEARGAQARLVEAGERELSDPLDACGYDQGLEVCEKQDGWLVITGKEGEDFRPVAFFFNRERADQYCALEIDDGCGGKENVAFDACALEASIVRDRIVCANDFDLDTHEKLRARAAETLSLADGEPAHSAVQEQAWIRVRSNGDFPPQGTTVLAYHPSWCTREGWVNSLGSVSGNWPGGDLATHWAPLPAPPAPEEG